MGTHLRRFLVDLRRNAVLMVGTALIVFLSLVIVLLATSDRDEWAARNFTGKAEIAGFELAVVSAPEVGSVDPGEDEAFLMDMGLSDPRVAELLTFLDEHPESYLSLRLDQLTGTDSFGRSVFSAQAGPGVVVITGAHVDDPRLPDRGWPGPTGAAVYGTVLEQIPEVTQQKIGGVPMEQRAEIPAGVQIEAGGGELQILTGPLILLGTDAVRQTGIHTADITDLAPAVRCACDGEQVRSLARKLTQDSSPLLFLVVASEGALGEMAREYATVQVIQGLIFNAAALVLIPLIVAAVSGVQRRCTPRFRTEGLVGVSPGGHLLRFHTLIVLAISLSIAAGAAVSRWVEEDFLGRGSSGGIDPWLLLALLLIIHLLAEITRPGSVLRRGSGRDGKELRP